MFKTILHMDEHLVSMSYCLSPESFVSAGKGGCRPLLIHSTHCDRINLKFSESMFELIVSQMPFILFIFIVEVIFSPKFQSL